MNIRKPRIVFFISVILALLVWISFGDLKTSINRNSNFLSPEYLSLHIRILLIILIGAFLSGSLIWYLFEDKLNIGFFKIFKQHPQPMWIFDLQSFKFLKVNDAAVIHYGYTRAEFYKMSVLDIRPADDKEKYRKLNMRTLRGFQFRNRAFSNDQTIWRHCKKNGDIIYVKTIAFYTHYLARKVALITVLDITDSYLQEKKVNEQKELLDALINSTDDFIWAVDKNLVPTASNSSYQKFIREVTGLYVEPDVSNILIRYSAAFVEMQKEYYLRALKGEKISTEREFDMENFALVYLELKFSPVELNGEIVGAVCFARNISERKRYTSKIERQVEVLQEIAVISSHDIRRPVSSILGLLDLIDKQNPANPENYQILEYMHLAANELDAMIYRIVERCTVEINLQRIPAEEILREEISATEILGKEISGEEIPAEEKLGEETLGEEISSIKILQVARDLEKENQQHIENQQQIIPFGPQVNNQHKSKKRQA